jgi:hypothetical protein
MDKGPIVGRNNYMNLVEDLIENKKQSVLLYGEWGIGKTTLLECYRDRLKRQGGYYVGYVSGKEGMDDAYPFIQVLASLLSEMTVREGDVIGGLKKIQAGLGNVIKDYRNISFRIGKAIISSVLDQALDNITKIGPLGVLNKDTLKKELGGIYDDLKDAAPEEEADRFISLHEGDSIMEQYILILENLAKQYSDEGFVLTFDHFEKFKDRTTDMLRGLIRNSGDPLPDNIRFLVVYDWPSIDRTEKDQRDNRFKEMQDVFMDVYFTKKNQILLEGLDADEVNAFAKGLEVELYYDKESARINSNKLDQTRTITRKTGGHPRAVMAVLSDLPKNASIPDSLIDRIPDDKIVALYAKYKKEYDALPENKQDKVQDIAQILSYIDQGNLDRYICEEIVLKCLENKVDSSYYYHCIDKFLSINFFKKFDDIEWFRHELLQRFVKDMQVPNKRYCNCVGSSLKQEIKKI